MFNRPLSRMPTSSLAHNDGWRWLDRGQLLPLPIYWPLTAPINRLLCLLGSWSTRLLNNVMTPFIIPTPHILECQQDNQLDSAQDTVIHIFSIRKQGYCYLTSGDGVCEKRHNISGSNGREELSPSYVTWNSLCTGQTLWEWEKRWYLWRWWTQGCGRSWPWHCRRCHITSH